MILGAESYLALTLANIRRSKCNVVNTLLVSLSALPLVHLKICLGAKAYPGQRYRLRTLILPINSSSSEPRRNLRVVLLSNSRSELSSVFSNFSTILVRKSSKYHVCVFYAKVLGFGGFLVAASYLSPSGSKYDLNPSASACTNAALHFS